MRTLIQEAEQAAKESFTKIEETEQFCSEKVLRAFQEHAVNEAHFAATTGYGYDDFGRDTLDNVFADVFGGEAALVRHTIISGTHAISLCMFGLLRPNDLLISVTGKPYDTLEEAIGIRGNESGSLKEYGVRYRQVELLEDGSPDYEGILDALQQNPKVVTIQRSKGYAWRKSLDIATLKELIAFIKTHSKAIVMVDNCYGEFVEKQEPTEIGADLIAGSLIKNAGGGLAPTGGYIVGKKTYIEQIANRLTCPGIGRECGASLGVNKAFFQGLFMAPSVVASALKTAVLTCAVFEKAGYEVCPSLSETRTDIIQAIKLGSAEKLVAYCQGIQKGSPVDSNVVPEPWDMPGYAHQVIMAAGAFTQGSSIELSADAPMKPPYIVFQQGGLTYAYGKLGLLTALKSLEEKNLL